MMKQGMHCSIFYIVSVCLSIGAGSSADVGQLPLSSALALSISFVFLGYQGQRVVPIGNIFLKYCQSVVPSQVCHYVLLLLPGWKGWPIRRGWSWYLLSNIFIPIPFMFCPSTCTSVSANNLKWGPHKCDASLKMALSKCQEVHPVSGPNSMLVMPSSYSLQLGL